MVAVSITRPLCGIPRVSKEVIGYIHNVDMDNPVEVSRLFENMVAELGANDRLVLLMTGAFMTAEMLYRARYELGLKSPGPHESHDLRVFRKDDVCVCDVSEFHTYFTSLVIPEIRSLCKDGADVDGGAARFVTLVEYLTAVLGSPKMHEKLCSSREFKNCAVNVANKKHFIKRIKFKYAYT